MWFLLLNFLCEQFLNEPESFKVQVFMGLPVGTLIYWIFETRRYSVLQDEEKSLTGNDRGSVIIYDTSVSPKEVLLRA